MGLWGALSVWVMAFADLLGPRLADLADFDRDTALHAGVAPSRVRQWSRVHDVYFGKTKFTRKQAQARKAAGSMPLDQLGLIERKLSVVSDPAERWRLRLELVGFSGRYDALSRLADSLIQVEKPAPKKACRFTKTRGGMRTVALTYNQRDIADLEFVLRSMINPELPAAEQMADALVRLLRGDGDGVARAVPRPVVMVPFPEWTRIQSGAGDEVTLTLTDGTTMTGAEFLAYEFGEALEVAAFHPAEGAVNLYRTARFANDKQRTLASMMTPSCPVPGCRHGADSCEMHHIDAWRFGGETNLANLVPLCRFHNGRNDDDPTVRRYGRIHIRDGTPIWVSPGGTPVENDTPGAMEQLFT